MFSVAIEQKRKWFRGIKWNLTALLQEQPWIRPAWPLAAAIIRQPVWIVRHDKVEWWCIAATAADAARYYGNRVWQEDSHDDNPLPATVSVRQPSEETPKRFHVDYAGQNDCSAEPC